MHKSKSYNTLFDMIYKKVEKKNEIVDFDTIIEYPNKILGIGNFGIVKEAIIPSLNIQIALKYCKYENNIELLREIEILQSIKNENIPKFYGIAINNNKIYLLMEKINGFTLKNILKNNPIYLKNNKFIIIKQIADILYYLHNHEPPIIYRDLKADNIMVTNNKVYLIDFGLSKYYHHEDSKNSEYYELTGNTGSLIYMAPEVYLNMSYNLKADIYSLGILIYIIVKQKYPNNIINYNNIITKKHEIFIDIYNSFYRNLCKNCLKISIDDRYNIYQVIQYLQMKKK